MKKKLVLASFLMYGIAFASPVSVNHTETYQPSPKAIASNISNNMTGYRYIVNVYNIPKTSPLYKSYVNLGSGITNDIKIPSESVTFNMAYSQNNSPMSVSHTQGYVAQKEFIVGPGKKNETDSYHTTTETVIQSIESKNKDGKTLVEIVPTTKTELSLTKNEKEDGKNETILIPGSITTGTLANVYGTLKDGQIQTNIFLTYSNPPKFREENGIQLPQVDSFNIHNTVNLPIGQTFYRTINKGEDLKILTVKFDR